MNHRQDALGLKRSKGFTQQSQKIFNVQKIEDHGLALRAIRYARALFNEVTQFGPYIEQTVGLCTFSRQLNHHRFDVQCCDGASHTLCRWKAERAKASGEFDRVIAATLSNDQPVENTFRLKKRGPVGFVRHAAFASLHAAAQCFAWPPDLAAASRPPLAFHSAKPPWRMRRLS